MKLNIQLFFLFLIMLLMNCTTTETADLIVHNAKIYTVNDAFDVAEAMVITNGKIIAIGAENEILNKYSAAKIIDAKKNPIYPGFIDAHCHFVGYALSLKEVNLVGTKSFDEVLQRVVDFAKTNNNEWIVGRGWDQNDWKIKDFPTNEKLNELFPNRAVFLTRIDGHAAIANAEVLRRANITYQTKVDGGIITFNVAQNKEDFKLNNSNHSETNSFSKYHPEPTGILIDNAIDLVAKILPQPTKKELTSALITAQFQLFEVGITTVDDAGLTKDTIDLINQLQQDGQLKIKVYAMISGTKEMLDYYLPKGPHKTDKLSVCSFKFYADGALGSRGACLLEPYSDIIEQQLYGLQIKEADFYQKYAQLIYDNGFQMNTHCIGDSANRLMLTIYGNVLKGVNDKRWRIEHAQIVNPQDVEKFKKFTIIPSIQPTHATSDMYWAKERLGENRVKSAYAYQQLLKQNGIVALGTDFPVEGISPIATFYAAVVRKDKKGFPPHGFQPKNALTRQEALKGMTIWAALSNFEENEKGSLEVGKSADFVLLNNDLMTIKEEHILTTKVLQTFINGELAFSIKK